MLAAARRCRFGATALSTLVALAGLGIGFYGAPAHANPLGLSNGDIIDFFEFDTLKSSPGNPGDGSFYDNSTNLYTGIGRITSVTTTTPDTIGQSGVDIFYQLTPTSEIVNFVGGTTYQVDILLSSPSGGTGTDWAFSEGGVNVLFGHFAASGVHVQGNVDLSQPAQSLTLVGLLNIDGGNSALVAALGGTMEFGHLLQTAAASGFSPTLATLYAGDNTAFNSNFSNNVSGVISPFNPSPFTVPEPATALLVGGGLLGLLGSVRWASRRAR